MDENTDGMLAIYEVAKTKTASELIAQFPEMYNSVLPVQKEQIYGIFRDCASKISNGAAKSIDAIYKALVNAEKADEKAISRQRAFERARECPVWLELDRNGLPLDTMNNYLNIMLNDPHYKGYRYNVLKASPEIDMSDPVKGIVKIRAWEDADEAESQRYIEERYGMYSDQKHKKALLLMFREREYNPVVEIVDNLPPWDGEERIRDFLTKWMGCDDTPYVHEVSRLIFAGGINRLYNPGCKFDDVPVLIGTRQGEGKSTIIRWLAIHDDFSAEVTQFEGNQAVEQLEGAWVCEISEMLAMNKSNEQEAVKAFITRQVDKYRKPYARNPSCLPRRVIFIGSTNQNRFLKDKTGNRRWYPVRVNMSGYDLYDMEEECRAYILQCWAEARDKFRKGEMPNFANKFLIADYREAQESAMEDDWRVGAISDYLSKFNVGDKVCVRQVFREALPMEGDTIKDPSKRDSHEIGLIMDKQQNWKRSVGSVWINSTYGSQKGWVKVKEDFKRVDEESTGEVEIPF